MRIDPKKPEGDFVWHKSQIDDLTEANRRASEAEKLQEDYWKPSSVIHRTVREILIEEETGSEKVIQLYISSILAYLYEQYDEQKER